MAEFIRQYNYRTARVKAELLTERRSSADHYTNKTSYALPTANKKLSYRLETGRLLCIFFAARLLSIAVITETYAK